MIFRFILQVMDRIEKLKTFLAQSPTDAFLIHALALEYLKIDVKEDALHYFETNRSQQPDYVGTYYHLGKLLEQMNREQDAIVVYEEGVAIAQKIKDNHALNELRAALDDLI